MKLSIIDLIVYVSEKILTPFKEKATKPVTLKGKSAPLYLVVLGIYSFFGLIFAFSKFGKVLDSCGEDSYSKGAATFYGYVLGFPFLIIKGLLGRGKTAPKVPAE